MTRHDAFDSPDHLLVGVARGDSSVSPHACALGADETPFNDELGGGQ